MSEFALGGEIVFLVSAFGVRTLLHWRRTGSTGFRVGRGASLAERVGVALLTLGGGLSVTGVVFDLAGLPGTFDTTGPLMRSLAGVAIAAFGLLLVLAGQTDMGGSWRIGVNQAEVTDLVTGGLFRYVRNPIFLGMLTFWVGIALIVPNALCILAPLVALTGMEIQVRCVEEPYLRRTHGAAYVRYAARTGRFVPYAGRVRSPDVL